MAVQEARIQINRATQDEYLAESGPRLMGELALVTDDDRIMVGDGATGINGLKGIPLIDGGKVKSVGDALNALDTSSPIATEDTVESAVASAGGGMSSLIASFLTPGVNSWTPPKNGTYEIMAIGGGGGGGSNTTGGDQAGSGGGGGCIVGRFNLATTDSLSITVGAGGAGGTGGTSPGDEGKAGGNSVVLLNGSIVLVAGGGGGGGGGGYTNGGSPGGGGGGGGASTTDNTAGTDGGTYSNLHSWGGDGGSANAGSGGKYGGTFAAPGAPGVNSTGGRGAEGGGTGKWGGVSILPLHFISASSGGVNLLGYGRGGSGAASVPGSPTASQSGAVVILG